MGKRLTPFQLGINARGGEVDVLDILREFANRLTLIHSYPPIIPQAGATLHDILNEVEEIQNVGRSDDTDQA